jgi:hypothetical protein
MRMSSIIMHVSRSLSFWRIDGYVGITRYIVMVEEQLAPNIARLQPVHVSLQSRSYYHGYACAVKNKDC